MSRSLGLISRSATRTVITTAPNLQTRLFTLEWLAGWDLDAAAGAQVGWIRRIDPGSGTGFMHGWIEWWNWLVQRAEKQPFDELVASDEGGGRDLESVFQNDVSRFHVPVPASRFAVGDGFSTPSFLEKKLRAPIQAPPRTRNAEQEPWNRPFSQRSFATAL
jgi:hypothetical protein